MFGSIRKKFNDVIHEGIVISENLSTSYLKPSNSQNNFEVNRTELGIPTDINLTSGCALLEQNEKTWRNLHERNEANAIKATSTDETITRIKEKTEKLYIDLTDLNVCLNSIAALENNLQTCNDMITNIGTLCKSLETKLVELEDVTEELDLQSRQIEHKFQMSMYKEKKMVELEEVRKRFALKHAENVKQYENELKKIQQERQAVFQDAFQHDLEIYKEKGSIPKVEHLKKNTLEPELSLEEITLDDSANKSELEEFLND